MQALGLLQGRVWLGWVDESLSEAPLILSRHAQQAVHLDGAQGGVMGVGWHFGLVAPLPRCHEVLAPGLRSRGPRKRSAGATALRLMGLPCCRKDTPEHWRSIERLLTKGESFLSNRAVRIVADCCNEWHPIRQPASRKNILDSCSCELFVGKIPMFHVSSPGNLLGNVAFPDARSSRHLSILFPACCPDGEGSDLSSSTQALKSLSES